MEFLLELLTEELPASHIRSALDQLEAGFREGAPRCPHRGRFAQDPGDAAAPRRRRRFRRGTGGPGGGRHRTAAGDRQGPDGALTPAGKGFARSQGVDESLLEAIPTAARRVPRLQAQGQGDADVRDPRPPLSPGPGRAVLPEDDALGGRARSGSPAPSTACFCVFGGIPVATSFEGFQATDETVGHRIAAPGPIKARISPNTQAALEKSFVVVDPDARKRMIVDQIEAALAPLKAKIYPDPELLDDLTLNVEHPLVVFGAFPEAYLSLPIEVLSTAMREGQKLFSVVRDKKQLPVFPRRRRRRRGREGPHPAGQRAGPQGPARGRPLLLGPGPQGAAAQTGGRAEERPLPGEARQLRGQGPAPEKDRRLPLRQARPDRDQGRGRRSRGTVQGRPADGHGQGLLRASRAAWAGSTPEQEAAAGSTRRSTSTTSRAASRTHRRPRPRGPSCRSRTRWIRSSARSASASRSAARVTPSACAATPTASARSRWTGSSGFPSRSFSTASWPSTATA